MLTALDILNGAKVDTTISSPAAATASQVVSAAPLTNTPSIQRFRAFQNQMQQTAKDAIKQEIVRIVGMPIILPPTEEEIEQISLYYATGG